VLGSCLAQLAAQVCSLALQLVHVRRQAGSPLLCPLQSKPGAAKRAK
jgi:hypothetical protein